MLIDCSYFTEGPRHILNSTLGTLPDPNAVEANAGIEAYIAEYQEEFLRLALGSSLGNKVHNYLVCLDEDASCKHTENFDVVCEKLKESFADYVFFHIMRDSNTQQTMTGLVRLKCANDYVAPIRRQVTVWNGMVKKNIRFIEWVGTSECPIEGIEMDKEVLTNINHFNL